MQICNKIVKHGKINSVSCLTEFHQASFWGVFGVFPGGCIPKAGSPSLLKAL